MQLIGYVKIRIERANGDVVEETVKNTVVNIGKAQVAGLIGGLVTTPFTYVAIGTDNGSTLALDATNTGLGAEVKRKSASVSRKTKTVTDDTLVLEATFSNADGLTGSQTIQEAGVFDANTGGNMLSRALIGPYTMNWDNGDALTITWEIQVQ